ncbi:hypothetical protein Q1695_010608 [Nippostrongylus brasiliensis]|nr:hypothetical protein Q1695_010608 [Nippostrongylus brasiliensis]
MDAGVWCAIADEVAGDRYDVAYVGRGVIASNRLWNEHRSVITPENAIALAVRDPMAEELNCDLDDGSHHGGSDSGSKSSMDDAQEQSKSTKGAFQAASEKMEDVLDLDYDEGSPNGTQERPDDGDEGEASSDGEIDDSSDENKKKEEDGDKEEGEIEDSEEDGEIEDKTPRKVPIEARLSRPVAAPKDKLVQSRTDCPYEINGSCTWGPDCNYIHRNKAEHGKIFARTKVAEETSWERGLREAREAMRRASKKREEPEFETKRLTAAPTGERIRNARDSDSDDGSSPLRRSPPSRHNIPSLLDITTLAPPRYHGRTSAHRDLGPQVRYPCGRPNPRRNEGRRSGGGDGSGQQSSRQDRGKDSSQRSRRDSPHNSSSTKSNRGARISPSLDVSPISSDSSMSPVRSPRKSGGGSNQDKGANKTAKKKMPSGSAMGDVTDPWARKKKNTAIRGGHDGKQRARSSSNSSTSSTNSSDKLRRATNTTSSNTRGSRRQRTPPPSTKNERRLSPPRGDIAGFRIPKKHRRSPSRERTSGPSRAGGGDGGRDVPLSRKSEAQKTNSERIRSSGRIFDGVAANTAGSRGAENISDSDSAESVSRSSSDVSSSSSRSSSESRSASPTLPAKYRVVGNKESASTSVEKNVTSVSDSDEDVKTRNHRKSQMKDKREAVSPQLREISPSPSPPPPPPPPDDANSRRRPFEKSVTPPPPPPPLPLIKESTTEKNNRKARDEKRPSEEKSKRERSPPKKKSKLNNEAMSAKERRKRELMEQLRAVEAELKKRTAAASAVV